MIAGLIRWSVANRLLVLLATLFATAWGIWAVKTTPVDALPDLSDVQVIIRTSYPGQAPRIVENQVTYPLATTMLSVPGAKTVRGFSFFGDSYVYVLFEDGTDLYWARSRVLEYLNQVQGRLPASARTSLGPDATGLGWIYEYALVDRSGRHDLSQLRALQDWFLKYELKTLPNVAEVATIGGMVRQYQVVLDPIKLAALGITRPGCAKRSRPPTRKPAAACWSRAKRNSWCARTVTSRRWTIFARSRSSSPAACRSRSATWPGSSRGRKCGAALPNSTARARRSAA